MSSVSDSSCCHLCVLDLADFVETVPDAEWAWWWRTPIMYMLTVVGYDCPDHGSPEYMSCGHTDIV